MLEAITGHFAEKAPVIIMIPFIVILALLVHELGHYIAARVSGMKVERVVIGFGKRLYSRKDKNGTEWFVHLWPFRAYVGIADFDVHKDKIWRRLFVVMAGPFASLVLPFLLMVPFFFLVGKPVVPPVVTGVEIGTPAYEAGLEPGDKILTIEGTPVAHVAEILPYTRPRPDEPLSFTFARDGEIRETAILQDWFSYRDYRGLEQAYGRIGATFQQQPYDYKTLKTIDGKTVESRDEARQLVHEYLGQRIIIGLKSVDDKVHDYLVDLDPQANRNMMNPDHDDYEYFYIGTMRDNHYLPMSMGSALGEGGSRTLELIRNVAKVPFQLFPIDKDWLTESYSVSNRSAPALYYFYRFVFLLSLFSVLIGMINLLPLPGLDGSVILLDTVEAVRRKPLTRKGKALWICGVLIVLYAAVITANKKDMEGYYGFLIEKVTEGEEEN